MKRLLFMGLVVTLMVTPVFGNHGGAFPLPLKHSVIAQTAEEMNAQIDSFCMPGAEEIAARFNLGGFHWLYVYSAKSEIGLFIQYRLNQPEVPQRIWIFRGSSDDITIVKDVEDPATVYPNGPCSVIYPTEA